MAADMDASGLFPQVAFDFEDHKLTTTGQLKADGASDVTEDMFENSGINGNAVLKGSSLTPSDGVMLYDANGYNAKLTGSDGAETFLPIAVSLFAKIAPAKDQVLFHVGYGSSEKGYGLVTRKVNSHLSLSVEWSHGAGMHLYTNVVWEAAEEIADGDFHHLVMSVDASQNIIIYLDGEQKALKTDSLKYYSDAAGATGHRSLAKGYKLIELGTFVGNNGLAGVCWGECRTDYDDVRVYAGENATLTNGHVAAINEAQVKKLSDALRAGSAVPVASEVAWTGNGADEGMSDIANWSAEPAYTGFRTKPVFALGGTRAVVDRAVEFSDVTFNAPGGFVIDGSADGSLTLAGNVIVTNVAAKPTETVDYVVNAPVILTSGVKMTVSDYARLSLLGGVTSDVPCSVAILGNPISSAKYDFTGATNGVIDVTGVVISNYCVKGDLEHVSGGGVLRLAGEVGQSGDGGKYTMDYGRYYDGKNQPWRVLGTTHFEGVTMHKAMDILGAGAQTGNYNMDKTTVALAGTTNVFEKPVTMSMATYVAGEKNARYVFNDTVTAKGQLKLMGASGTTAAEPAQFVFNAPLKHAIDNRALEIKDGRSVTWFNAPGSYSSWKQFRFSDEVYMTVSNAFVDTSFIFNSANAVLHLGNTRQVVPRLLSRRKYNTDARSGRIDGVYPSAIAVTNGAPSAALAHVEYTSFSTFPEDCPCTNSQQQITGWVTLEKSGPGWLAMARGEALESYGDIRLSGGTLEFMPDTTWLNGTNVVLSGESELILPGVTFGEQAVLTADGEGWRMSVPEGTVQVFSAAVVDGEPLAPGTYGSEDSPAKDKSLSAHFTGTGVIKVAAPKTGLIFFLH